MNHQIFISYSSKHKQVAVDVCQFLETNNFKCWMAPRDIPAGSDYGDLIEQAIVRAEAVVLIYNEAALQSKWVKGEINTAFDEDKVIFPFKTQDVPLHGSLRVMLNQFHWIDAVGDTKRGSEELLFEIKKICKDPIDTRILAEINMLLKDWKDMQSHSEALYEQILKKEGLLHNPNHSASREIEALLKGNDEEVKKKNDEIENLKKEKKYLEEKSDECIKLRSQLDALIKDNKELTGQLALINNKRNIEKEGELKYVQLRDVIELVVLAARREQITPINSYMYADIDEKKLRLAIKDKYGLSKPVSTTSSLTVAEAGWIVWKDVNKHTKGNNCHTYRITESILNFVFTVHYGQISSITSKELKDFIFRTYGIDVNISYSDNLIQTIENTTRLILNINPN